MNMLKQELNDVGYMHKIQLHEAIQSKNYAWCIHLVRLWSKVSLSRDIHIVTIKENKWK